MVGTRRSRLPVGGRICTTRFVATVQPACWRQKFRDAMRRFLRNFCPPQYGLAISLLFELSETIRPSWFGGSARTLDHDDPLGREQSGCSIDVHRELLFAEIVGGVKHDDIEPLATCGCPGTVQWGGGAQVEIALYRRSRHLYLGRTRGAKCTPNGLRVLRRDLCRLRMFLDQHDSRCAATRCFESECARSSVKIEHSRTFDEVPRFEGRENRLANTIAGGSRSRFRHLEPQRTGGTRNNPCHGSSVTGRGRLSVASASLIAWQTPPLIPA